MFTVSQLIPVDQALSHLLAAQLPQSATVELPLKEALGAVLAQAQQAEVDVPAFDNSAMDGFAVSSADIKTNTELAITQIISAGHPGEALIPGTAARIFTGAPIPEGADAVVIQENTQMVADKVRILQAAEPGQHIRRRGHDIRIHTEVLAAGHRLRPQDLGLLASLGASRVSVSRPLTVAVINTGDEVVSPGRELQAGQLYDSNSFTLTGLLTSLGCKVLPVGIVADSLAATEAALESAASNADCIITTGGVSVGEADYVRAALKRLGTLTMWKLAIKPGKPFSFGQLGDVPLFGLPGNPVAVFVTFVMLVRPCLLKILGASQLQAPEFRIAAGFDINTPGSRQEYLRVRLEMDQSGAPSLGIFPDQGSSVLTSLSWADGLAVVPVDTRVKTGDPLTFIPFSGLI